MNNHLQKPYMPFEAIVTKYRQEQEDIFTIRLKPTDPVIAEQYDFQPGQFNMLYLYGVGEVAISIVNDAYFRQGYFEHTIQVIGRVTKGLAKAKAGQTIGVRGPFGQSWPGLEALTGKDIVVVTGGLGNAPLVAQVESLLKSKHKLGRIYVIQGLREAEGLIYRDKYQRWNDVDQVEVQLAASQGAFFGDWRWYRGFVTEAIPNLCVDYANTVVLSVGPEIMMKNVAQQFNELGVSTENIYISLERNMKCAIGHCGHCQLGAEFVCKDGPVYSYANVKDLLEVKGM